MPAVLTVFLARPIMSLLRSRLMRSLHVTFAAKIYPMLAILGLPRLRQQRLPERSVAEIWSGARELWAVPWYQTEADARHLVTWQILTKLLSEKFHGTNVRPGLNGQDL